MEKVRQQVTRNAADSTPGPSVGDYRTFFTRDVQDMDQFYQVEATCLLVSEQLVIWIATNDRQQLPASVSVSSILNQLSNFLVNQTPATSVNPQAGILSIEQSYFGKPPVVGGSSRLNIFLLDIRDDFQQSGSYVAGFFDPVNLTDDSRSNHLNLDYSPRNLVVIKAEKKCRRKGTCVP